jgi:cytoskeletal protein CcmA (bactofilin family)
MLFSSSEKKTTNKIESFVGAGTEIEGNIRTNEVVRIDGRIKGEVNAESVVIGQNGVVLGDISANKVTVAGKVKGNISAAATLELLPSGHVIGDLRANKLIISDGACFEGNCQMVKSDGQIIEMNPSAVTLEVELPEGKKVKVIGDHSRR